MMSKHQGMIARLVGSVLDAERTRRAIETLEIDPAIDGPAEGDCSRGAFAMALAVCLFDDLLKRVPTGALYVAERTAAGAKLVFDHGAIRTVCFPDGPSGALPCGVEALARILGPLGYRIAGTYPLPALRMTGRAFCHMDHAAAIPQYFVSELHVDQFDASFGAVAERVFGSSRDPLGDAARALLACFAGGGAAPFALAERGLPEILAAFDRQHDVPQLIDYEALRAQSAEAAWIATEGNAFNHATDRVADVEALADGQRLRGRPIKDRVEVSSNGRVQQTAFRADTVRRQFATADGMVERDVPGSFYEFITRTVDPATGALDLSFDSGNATGIFQMTKAA